VQQVRQAQGRRPHSTVLW